VLTRGENWTLGRDPEILRCDDRSRRADALDRRIGIRNRVPIRRRPVLSPGHRVWALRLSLAWVVVAVGIAWDDGPPVLPDVCGLLARVYGRRLGPRAVHTDGLVVGGLDGLRLQ